MALVEMETVVVMVVIEKEIDRIGQVDQEVDHHDEIMIEVSLAFLPSTSHSHMTD